MKLDWWFLKLNTDNINDVYWKKKKDFSYIAPLLSDRRQTKTVCQGELTKKKHLNHSRFATDAGP